MLKLKYFYIAGQIKYKSSVSFYFINIGTSVFKTMYVLAFVAHMQIAQCWSRTRQQGEEVENIPGRSNRIGKGSKRRWTLQQWKARETT